MADDGDWQVVKNVRKDTKRSQQRAHVTHMSPVPASATSPSSSFTSAAAAVGSSTPANTTPSTTSHTTTSTSGAAPLRSTPGSTSFKPRFGNAGPKTESDKPRKPDSVPVPLSSLKLETRDLNSLFSHAPALLSSSSLKVRNSDGSEREVSAVSVVKQLLHLADHSDGFTSLLCIFGVLFAAPGTVSQMSAELKSRIVASIDAVIAAKERRKSQHHHSSSSNATSANTTTSTAVSTVVFLEPLRCMLTGAPLPYVSVPVKALGELLSTFTEGSSNAWCLPGTERFLKGRFFAEGIFSDAVRHVDGFLRRANTESFALWPATVNFESSMGLAQTLFQSSLMNVLLAVAIRHKICWAPSFAVIEGHGVYMDFDFTWVEASNAVAAWVHQVAPSPLFGATVLDKDVLKQGLEKLVRPAEKEEDESKKEEAKNAFLAWVRSYDLSVALVTKGDRDWVYAVRSYSSAADGLDKVWQRMGESDFVDWPCSGLQENAKVRYPSMFVLKDQKIAAVVKTEGAAAESLTYVHFSREGDSDVVVRVASMSA